MFPPVASYHMVVWTDRQDLQLQSAAQKEFDFDFALRVTLLLPRTQESDTSLTP